MALDTIPTGDLLLTPIATISGLPGAEISAYDAGSKKLFTTSSIGVSVIDLTNPAAPGTPTTLNLTTLGFATTDVTSVAVKNGIVAVALPAAVKTDPGQVVFLDAATNALLGSVTVGALPDMVTFTPDGSKVLVANEGEYAAGGTDPAKGTVSIIDISGGIASATVQTADFTSYDGQEAALRDAGVRIFPGRSVSNDVEPEYIAVSPDGSKAFVTLQEANAIAILDIGTATFTDIVPLGLKDFSGLMADFSDRDGPGSTTLTKLESGNPVFGLYMPDAIGSYEAEGQVYYVIANEGDDRDDFLAPDETIRVGSGSYDLDNATFPTEATLKTNAELGRLTVSNIGTGSTDANITQLRGDTDGDGDIDQILAYGARSFSILDSNGTIVFDSADIIERVTATLPGAFFDDTRSDNKAAEPEGVTVGTVGSKTYAFVTLERSNAIVTFDISNPMSPTFTGYTDKAGDTSPEGVLFVDAASSPNGAELLIVSNEVSNTVTVYEAESTFQLQLLHFADGEAGLLAGDTAPNLAALVDAFEDDFAHTLILAGGDNYIPGPFAAAGTDASVAATHNKGNNPFAADIEIHNRIGVEASTIGNHEFDFGTNAFSDAIGDSAFPYLSANLDFSGDSGISARYQETVGVGGLEEASTLARKIVPSAVVTKGGEQIGLVGVTTQILEAISSTGGVEVKGFAGDGSETNDMALLAAQLQPVIDDLRSQGVNKIVLMSHLQQIAFEQALAPLLSGVDIILAAGSNTRLGDADDVAVEFPGHAANFANTYPIVTTGADGGTTLIVNTDNEYTYLGRLVVNFDQDGNIVVDDLAAYRPINGAYASTEANVAAAWADQGGVAAAFAEGTKGEQVADITEAVDAVILAKDGVVPGFTNVYLEGERNLVRNQETNLGNITADANLDALTNALGAAADTAFVASLKNGGGIRAQIGAVDVVTGAKEPPLANPAAGKPEGGVSVLDIENSLRFNNGLMAFDTTAAGLKAILEHGVALLGNQGRYPQIGGVSFSYDKDLPAGARIQSIALIDENDRIVATIVENGVVDPAAPATITMVTLNFLANGGDGYPIKANGENFRFLLNDGTLSAPVDEALNFTAAGVVPANILGEQQAMIEYMADRYGTTATAFDVADTAQAGDLRIQNLDFRADTVLDRPLNLTGTTGNDTQTGSDMSDMLDPGAGNDRVDAGAGDDTVFGSEGNDTLDGGEGIDTLDFSHETSGVSVRLQGGSSTGDRYLGFENLVGSDFSDRLFGTAGDNMIEGGGGDDSIHAGDGNDTLDGGDGNDTLQGSGGDDLLEGGADADLLIASEGSDTVNGGEGADTLQGSAGDDVMDGGDGNDNLSGAAGADSLDGGADDDYLHGGDDADTLQGGSGNDSLQGGNGDDLLEGGAGADQLIASAGNDTLAGGEGADTLQGSLGADVFVFNSALGGGNVDQILDMQVGIDTVRLDSTVFTALGAGSLDAAAFVSGRGLTAAQDADDRIIYNTIDGALYYDADGAGGQAAEQFAIVRPRTLTADDFDIV